MADEGVAVIELFVVTELPGVDTDEIAVPVRVLRGLRQSSESVKFARTVVSNENSGRGGSSGGISSSSAPAVSFDLNTRLEGSEHSYLSFEGSGCGINVDIGLRAIRN